MRGNSHVRFLGGKGVAILPTYPILIQDNSPLENVLEMYRCAREFGRC